MSEAQEIALGRESDTQIRAEMGVYDDPDLQRYIADIGMRLAKVSERPNLPWQFTVVDQPAINAFALPGGFIYITRGILPFLADEAELAGVLGHEVGHVTARHSVRQYTRALGGQLALGALGAFVPAARPFGQATEQALGLMFLKYGRDDERQSDQLGTRYEASVGWDPAGVPGMLATLGRLSEADGERKGVPNFLSTHPDPLSRVTEIRPTVDRLRGGRDDWRVNRDALLQRVDGIVFGDDPNQGITRGHVFLHPALRFAIDFPVGWQVANGAQQVSARPSEGDMALVLQVVEGQTGSLQDVAQTTMANAGFRRVQGARSAINGLDAYVGTYDGQIEGLGQVTARAAHIAHAGKVYLVAGLCPPPAFDKADPLFSTAIRSFRALSAADAEGIRPSRIDLYVVRGGDTWAALAERSGGAVTPAALSIMNGAAPTSSPEVGRRIKIVVAG